MHKPLSVALLLLVLAAVAWDIVIHARPVLAQSSPTVYVDEVDWRTLRHSANLTIKGAQVVGFSCESGNCFVLSK
jgi:hypothetical protein